MGSSLRCVVVFPIMDVCWKKVERKVSVMSINISHSMSTWRPWGPQGINNDNARWLAQKYAWMNREPSNLSIWLRSLIENLI
jgi:hypothetical protein